MCIKNLHQKRFRVAMMLVVMLNEEQIKNNEKCTGKIDRKSVGGLTVRSIIGH